MFQTNRIPMNQSDTSTALVSVSHGELLNRESALTVNKLFESVKHADARHFHCLYNEKRTICKCVCFRKLAYIFMALRIEMCFTLVSLRSPLREVQFVLLSRALPKWQLHTADCSTLFGFWSNVWVLLAPSAPSHWDFQECFCKARCIGTRLTKGELI